MASKNYTKNFDSKKIQPFCPDLRCNFLFWQTELKFLTSREHWDFKIMGETLEQYLLPFQEKHYFDGDFYFIQDNAKPHKCGLCHQFLQQNYEPNIIEHPSLSPDLNPIEKIWGFMKTEIYDNENKEYQNRRDLKKSILISWDKLSIETIRMHIDDLFNKRLNKVITTNGNLIV